MSKIENLELSSDESVLWTRKPEPTPIMFVGVMWIIFISGIIATPLQYISVPSIILYPLATVFVIFSLVHFWFAATQTRYVLTNKRLFVFDGGLRPVSASIDRSEITGIDVEKSVTESLIGNGRLVFRTKDNKLLTLSSLPSPLGLANTISEHMPNASVDDNVTTSTQAKGVTWPRTFAKDK
jgi:hypothetical protein